MYKSLISDAFKKSVSLSESVDPFLALNKENNLSREELLHGLGKLLETSNINTNVSRKYIYRSFLQKILLFMIASVLICTGWAMIIMPAPPSFEIFTVFYINPEDGVTIMDLVSLLIILSGVFSSLLISIKNNGVTSFYRWC